ncbi:ROK family transcriptional regulator [Actinocrispum wychmicini]|uniref:Putative NBD/HSP70 family sugar kinase n=1 Tax=Actinocrispum wychmicini TaxID=1213861 RepID=A0A4R2K0Q6_9PSEU|nr:ROK family transcriptional regulator [Actinocrispum wychmicini]TCO59895.1 putative NBD/HSP70 family sugar kinase [Actinocrispum wychmicini]
MTRTPRVTRPTQARNTNGAALFQLLITTPLSRAEIATRLGLTQGAVTRIAAALMDAGLLRELGPVSKSPSAIAGPDAVPGATAETPEYNPVLGRSCGDARNRPDPDSHRTGTSIQALNARSTQGGRPRVPLAIVPDARFAIGVHFGLQWTTVGLVNLQGECVTWRRHERDPSDVTTTLREASVLVDEVAAGAPGPVIGVGATTGGWVDPTSGVVRANEALGWREVSLAERFGAQVGPPVTVDSHVRSETLAELLFGAARTVSDIAYLFVGNVLELGLSVNREVRVGVAGAEGSVADLIVPAGDRAAPNKYVRLGDVATDRAVLAAARRSKTVTARDGIAELAALASRGVTAREQRADAILRERATRIGGAVAQLMTLLDPELMVVGGSVPAYLDDVRAVVARLTGRWGSAERIVASGLGEQPLVTASAAAVLVGFYDDPVGWN